MLKIRSLIASNRHEEALHHIKELLAKDESNPSYWVVLGDLIQLQQEEPLLYTLKDAEEAYLKAIEIDPRSLAALEELFHFYHAVIQDYEKAAKYANLFLDRIRLTLSKIEEHQGERR